MRILIFSVLDDQILEHEHVRTACQVLKYLPASIFLNFLLYLLFVTQNIIL